MSGWKNMLGGGNTHPQGAETLVEADEPLPPLPDPTAYKAYHLQRGPGRPAMFLDIRRFDARSGTLVGTMLSYPSLLAVEYFDDHTVDLNFGMRNVRIEGQKLSELVQRLQTGAVLVVQQYSETIWGKERPVGPIIDKITDMGLAEGH